MLFTTVAEPVNPETLPSVRLTVAPALLLAVDARAQGDQPEDLLELRSALKGMLLLSRARLVTPLTPEEVSSASLWRARFEPRWSLTSWLVAWGAYARRAGRLRAARALALERYLLSCTWGPTRT